MFSRLFSFLQNRNHLVFICLNLKILAMSEMYCAIEKDFKINLKVFEELFYWYDQQLSNKNSLVKHCFLFYTKVQVFFQRRFIYIHVFVFNLTMITA